jgi:hypothetical protein
MVALTLDSAQAELREPTPQEIVEFYFKDKANIALAIAQCESGQQQFKKDGTVVRSDTRDSGFFQINDIHLPEAQKMGLDVKNSLYDNIIMAKHIYDTAGSFKPWTTYRNGCYKTHLK